ncbi:hypothetical protein CGLAR1_02690 [Corynebacterium glutamicum]|uniref:DUF3349 domain-containing protein n=1 Tax=Corynebacterium glutamicum TaxID=1718 RepID=UPI0004F717F5|nr:DUF3349 domain-containing protein [Corynebacterium glutamicum]AIK84189.1 hypothetical protein CGLAR1_02690 [Corynebacterium glutamicum]AIK86973.1 hypothetical protein AR0_02825 [Corynebacterium glutamicum]QDQ20056.1 DUF3349 domain-containing protein [Corynebacterium glutamicum]QDQ23623.1 DUF3349 domain-containing protein [Corynebacterium glutamicum]
MSHNDSPNFARRALNWLRQGYPTGVPRHDTFALFYVLERELTEEDLNELVELLIAEGENNGLHDKPITREKIGELITHVHSQPPEDEDIDRIQKKLQAEGFPTRN